MAKPRWFRFSLRTLFVLVTVVCVWLGWQLKWIRDRHAAITWLGTQAKYWEDMPVQQGSFPGVNAPWQIRLLGEPGIKLISVIVEKAEVEAKQRELEKLFPEASVSRAVATLIPKARD